ncbi:hypothetical protein C8Q74DRAFT_378757 [Fomes fomentarius]|nr:hypothetical protein C8Q74DRAFT_378757 [Fomes fomentarius]
MSLAALVLLSVTGCHPAGTMITSRGKFADSSPLMIDKSHTPSLDSQEIYSLYATSDSVGRLRGEVTAKVRCHTVAPADRIGLT